MAFNVSCPPFEIGGFTPCATGRVCYFSSDTLHRLCVTFTVRLPRLSESTFPVGEKYEKSLFFDQKTCWLGRNAVSGYNAGSNYSTSRMYSHGFFCDKGGLSGIVCVCGCVCVNKITFIELHT